VRHFAFDLIVMRISILAAVSENGAIGRGGKLPWHLADDLKRFKKLTMGHAVIMGRKTWESIRRLLAGRRMIVVSRQADYQTGFAEVDVVSSVDVALACAAAAGDSEVFVIGGAELYRAVLPRANRLYLTRVLANVDGDTFFPEVDWSAWSVKESELCEADANNDHPQRFEIYERNA
jgi:dihydrofolate reductase